MVNALDYESMAQKSNPDYWYQKEVAGYPLKIEKYKSAFTELKQKFDMLESKYMDTLSTLDGINRLITKEEESHAAEVPSVSVLLLRNEFLRTIESYQPDTTVYNFDVNVEIKMKRLHSCDEPDATVIACLLESMGDLKDQLETQFIGFKRVLKKMYDTSFQLLSFYDWTSEIQGLKKNVQKTSAKKSELEERIVNAF